VEPTAKALEVTVTPASELDMARGRAQLAAV